MPKQKTHSGAKKKFKVTGTGKLLRRSARCQSHHLEHKSPKQKRAFSKDQPVDPDEREDRQPHAGKAVARCLASSAPFTPARSGARSSARPRATGDSRSRTTRTRRSRSSARSPTRTATARSASASSGKLWIMRINAGARAHGLSYNQFMHGLKAGERRARPEGARRPRGRRPGEVRRDRRAGEVGSRRARNNAASRDLQPPGRLLRRPFAAVCGAVPPARGRPARRRHRSRPRLGSPAAVARRPALPRAGRPRVVGGRR